MAHVRITRFLTCLTATGAMACGTGGMASMKDGGAGDSESPLPACPASTMDPDGGLPAGDAGLAGIGPGFDGSTGGGASLAVADASPDAAYLTAYLYPVPPALPPDTPVRPMSPLYRLYESPPADVLVTIPLDPAYAGCSAALYENTTDVTVPSPPPGPHPWHRLSADLSMRSVSARVPPNVDSTGTTQGVLLLAGTCDSECAGDCVDLLNDDANCGGCGQACAAPTFCVQGACGGQVLAMKSPGPPLLAVDGDMVYFVEVGTPAPGGPFDLIEGVPKAGGPTSVIVADAGGAVQDLRAFAGTVYWSYVAPSVGGTFIASQPADGGAPFIIGGGPFQGVSGPIAVDGSRVYFAITGPPPSPPGPDGGPSGPAGPSGLVALALDAASTSGATMLAPTAGQVPGIDTDGSHLAWIENQSVKVLDLSTAGAPPVTLGPASAPKATALAMVAVDGDAVVMMGGGDKPPAGGFPNAFVLLRAPIDGSAPEELAHPNEPFGMAARAGTVAWTEQYGPGTAWAKRPAQSPVRLLSGGAAGAVVLDDQAAYVMTTAIWRLALPQ